MDKLTIRDIDVKDKRVLVRVDFNVPMNEDTGEITDDSRIHASLPTIKYLVDHKAKVILCSHLGRPKGAPEDKFRLTPVAKRLSEIIGKPVLLRPKVDPAIIGGIIIRVGDKLIDGSIRSKLAALRKDLGGVAN